MQTEPDIDILVIFYILLFTYFFTLTRNDSGVDIFNEGMVSFLSLVNCTKVKVTDQ